MSQLIDAIVVVAPVSFFAGMLVGMALVQNLSKDSRR